MKLDEYHYHEAMDRAHVARDHFFEYVAEHPVVEANPELKTQAEKVMEEMGVMYQLCAHYSGPGSSYKEIS